MRTIAHRLLVVGVLILALACRPDVEQHRIVVGVGSTSEQRTLAALTLVALDEAGLAAEVQPDIGSTVELRREALRENIDLFWDYTGAAWSLGLGNAAPPPDPVESYERVARADEDTGLTWLEPTEANATLALFVREDLETDEDGRPGLTWLAGALSAGEGRLCADEDFVVRQGGLDALADAYAIDTSRLEVQTASEEEAIAAVAAGDCLAGLATATSGEARTAGLVPVTDDLEVFPAFVVAPVAREEVVAAIPELAPALADVAGAIDTATLAALSAEISAGAEPEDVAASFVAEHGSH